MLGNENSGLTLIKIWLVFGKVLTVLNITLIYEVSPATELAEFENAITIDDIFFGELILKKFYTFLFQLLQI
jgi:hypothetical protein